MNLFHNKTKPLLQIEVSIVILGWNSGRYLPYCLEALTKQKFRDFEVIIVDNGSTDESTNDLKAHSALPLLIIERLNENRGFASANNLGARLARGKWIALLNADAYPEADWLSNLLAAADRHPAFNFLSSRQIQYNSPGLLDGAGDEYHISGLAWRRYYNLKAESHGMNEEEIFGACAAAAMYCRDDFLKAGGFDEDYFSYFEDVDLSFRLRLEGGRCLYVPGAVVHHVGSASTGKRSDFSVYYGYRNLMWTFIKDMPSPWIWIFFPLHLATMLFFVFYASFRGQGKAIWSAIFDGVRGAPKMFAKRREIQKTCKVSPNELIRVMSTGLFVPYKEFVKRNQKS